jgi:phage repressor protein C with HTH and peptisase S24 domain
MGAKEIGVRLAMVRGRMGREEFARLVGVSVSTLARYERGVRSPDADFVALLRERFGVDPGWFITGQGERPQIPGPRDVHGVAAALWGTAETHFAQRPEPDLVVPAWTNPDPTQFDFVPMVEPHLSPHGDAFVLSEGTGDYYAFRKDWLRRMVVDVRRVVLMAVKGPGMAPTILDGDVVMIDGGRTRIHDGCIYALGIEGTITIKRVETLPGRIRIIQENRSAFPPYEADPASVRVLGRVTWYARTLVSAGM